MKKVQSLDLLFEPQIYKTGKTLYKNLILIDASQNEKGWYDYQIDDKGVFHVSLEKPLTSQQKFGCNCAAFSKETGCKHVVAVLLYHQEHQKTKGKKPKINNSRKTITVRSLLGQVSHEELSNFVQAYATKDTKFSNALKVNFIRKIDIDDNEDKYRVILNNLVKPISSKEHKLKVNEVKHLLKTTDEFLEQAQDAYALEEYLEAYYILNTVLSKLHYIDHHFQDYSKDIESSIKQYYTVLSYLLEDKKVAPDLRLKIRTYLYELIQTSYFHAKLPYYNAYELLINYFIKDVEKTLEHLRLKIERTIHTDEKVVLYSLLFAYDKSLYKTKQFEVAVDFVPNMDKVLRILSDQNTNIALEVAHYYAKRYPREISFTANILEVYHKQKEYSKFCEFAAETFGNTSDLRIIDLVYRFNHPSYLDEIREYLKDKLNPKIKPHQKAEMFAKVHDWPSLMKIMYEMKDVRTLMKYDKELSKPFPEELTFLYITLVESFMEMHIGTNTHQFILELKQHLDQRKLKYISKKIDALIQEKFKHRTRLNDIDY